MYVGFSTLEHLHLQVYRQVVVSANVNEASFETSEKSEHSRSITHNEAGSIDRVSDMLEKFLRPRIADRVADS